ncbi:MAG: Flp family type IVb pilin [Zavarzinella sp.]
MTQAFISFMKKEDGPTAVEYAIMLALIVTICIGVIATIGSNSPAAMAVTGGN